MKTLLTLLGPAFNWTWKTSVAAAALVILVFVVQAFLARWLTSRLRYTLSLLILIRLLLPMAPSSRLSLENVLRHAPPAKEAANASSALVSSDTEGIRRRLSSQPVNAATPVAKTAVSSAPRLTAVEWFSLGWAAGFLILLIAACWRYARWKRLIRRAEAVSEPALLELLQKVRGRMAVRRPVQLLVVPWLNSPAVFGVWRVYLLLPETAMSRLSAEELRLIFLHEMAHVRRNDIALNFLLIALQYVHWFNPLIWIASHRIRADRELVCDSIVMENMQAGERPRYGQLLLKLIEEFPAQAPIVPQAIALISSKQEIKRRLIMIKHHRSATFSAVSATVLAVIALAGATFTHADNTFGTGDTPRGNWNQSVPAPSGLVGLWKGEGNANDSAGMNNGSLSPSGATYTDGKVGQAFWFDGTNGYVEVPDSGALKPANVTVEAWVWLDPSLPAGGGHEQIVFKKNTWGAWFEGYDLKKATLEDGTHSDHFQFVVAREGKQVAVNSQTIVQRGVWYHVAATYDGNQSVLYVNGVAEAEATAGFALDYDKTPLYIGTTGTWAPYLNMFGGAIDEVSIYNRALSPNEIQSIYSAGSFGKYPLPVTDATAKTPVVISTDGSNAAVVFKDSIELSRHNVK